MTSPTPRPYQRSAEEQVLAYAADHPTGRLLLVMPTRSGKTFVGARLVRRMAVRQGLRALWIVHREELLDQAVKGLATVGIHPASIGVVKSGRSSDPDAKVQVATWQTLSRRRLPVAHIVVTDESHLDTAPSRRRLRRAYPKAFLLGLTATPKPPPKRDLGEDYDSMLVVVQPSELIHDGYLAAPVVYAPARDRVPDLRGVQVVNGDYREEDLEPLLLRAETMDEQVSEWARLSEERTTLAYPVTRRHSQALTARFLAAGVKAVHLDGDTPTEERRAVVAGLRDGRIPVVCSPGVLSEGTDLPRVKGILGVRPTASLVLYTQQNMRCATPFEDVRPRIFDTVGNVYKHGLPCEDRRWSFREEENGQPLRGGPGFVRRCGCGAVAPVGARECPGCKAVFLAPAPVIPTTPLELVPVTPAPKKLTAEQQRLLDYAKSRGFKRPAQWVEEVLAKKYGAEEGARL